MRNEPIDLYLESLENLLCLKACGRVSLFIGRDRSGSIEWRMAQLSWVNHETLFLFLILSLSLPVRLPPISISYNQKIFTQAMSREVT